MLLTGGRGFTGRYVQASLRRAGYEAVSLVRNAPTGADIAADLIDITAVRRAVVKVRPQYVIHLAALTYVAYPDHSAFYQVNLFGTLNLLQALSDETVTPRKIVLASSANVYGNQPVPPVSEGACPAPTNHYAMSKLAMEHMARTWRNRFPLIITRAFNYTGAGQHENFVVPKIVSHCRRKAPAIRLGNIEVEREFNDVRTIGDAYVALLDSGVSDVTVNLCTGKGHRLIDVLERVQQISGHDMRVETDGALLRASEVGVLVGDPSLMQRILPELSYPSLDETLRWMWSEGN